MKMHGITHIKILTSLPECVWKELRYSLKRRPEGPRRIRDSVGKSVTSAGNETTITQAWKPQPALHSLLSYIS